MSGFGPLNDGWRNDSAWQPPVNLDAFLPLENTPLDDGSDAWWGMSAVYGVVAGVAAALSVSVAIAGTFRYNDDVVPWLPSQATSHSTPYGQRARQGTTFLKWNQSDDLPIAAASVALDDGDRAPPNLSIAPADGIIWATDEEIFPQQAAALDDGSWIQFAIPASKIQVAGPQWDDGASGWLRAVEDYWWSAPPIGREPYRPALGIEDDSIPTASFAPDDDYWTPLPRRDAIAPNAISADDDFIRLAATPPEEEFWQWPAARIVPPVCNVFAADDEWIPSATFTPNEQYWQAPPARLVPAVAAPWIVEDERPTPPAFTPSDDDGWQVVVTRAAAPSILWVAADDEIPTASAASAYEDDSWQAPVFVAKTQIQGPGWDDQVIYSLVDEEYCWVAAPIVGGITRLPLWVDDEIIPKPFREEEYWFTARAYFDKLHGRAFAADDEVVPTFREEEYWLILRPNFDLMYGKVFAADDEIVPQPIIVTPSEGRTYTARAENREYSIAPQDREYIVPAQDSKLEI